MGAASGQSTAPAVSTLSVRSLAARWPWGLLLLAVPVAAVVVPPLYVHSAPHLLGVPFVVWYQFVVVAGSALLTLAVRALCFPAYAEPADESASAPSPAAGDQG